MPDDRKSANANAPIISLENIAFGYGEPILRDLNFSLYPGQAVGLAGPNGAGKTSLFRCITGLSKIWQGAIKFYGERICDEAGFGRLRRKVGYVLQDADDQLFFPEVLEDLTFGPLNLGLSPQAAREEAEKALELVGLPGYGARLSHTLSGGEKRLVALAAMLAMKPNALLLDEPENALDVKATSHLVELLRRLPCAKFIISHEPSFLARTCDEVLTLREGHLEKFSTP